MSQKLNYSEMLFNRDERLLDYITNLQEENKKSFEKGYAEGIIVAELDNENEFIVAYKELKQRIDKAIEYCKEALDLKEEYNDEVECVVNDLLDILKGGNNEK